MILEHPIPPFLEWLLQGYSYTMGETTTHVPPALQSWFLAVAVLLVTALIVGGVLSVLRHGFGDFITPFFRAVQRGIEDFTLLSFSRTWAIARLTIKESLRRRVLVIFALFMLILLVAGWYIDPGSENPAKLYQSFVTSTTSVLVLLLSLFLSSFSLPTDFKTKTIYSVVTKPVRSSEIVLGRIVGVGTIASAILVCMAVISYFFVIWGLQHTHLLVEKEDLTAVSLDSGAKAEDPKRIVFQGETQLSNGHKHHVDVHADGTVSVTAVNGHTHTITTEKVNEQTRYNVGVERGTIQARVPVYGKLGFRGKDGMDTEKGINVGDEWEYRTYIGGSTKLSDAANEESAIYTFNGVHSDLFPKELNGVPVEMTLGVFRTHKGDIEKRITASLAVRNPETGLKVEVMTFSTEEFITKSLLIPAKFEGTPQIVQRKGSKGGVFYAHPDDATMQQEKLNPNFGDRKEFDFFKDFVANGKVEVWLQCIDNMQYIGVAQSDLYLRGSDGNVPFNFAKGFFGLWMQMIVITSFGVLFSTFLSGPVAMISSIGILIAGFSKAFMMEIGLNKVLGGGPLESFYRLIIQQNMVVDLPSSFATTFIKSVDKVFGLFMQLFGQAIPPLTDYAVYDNALVSGFDIPWNWLAVHGVMTLSYVIPLFIVAYLILSNREVAK